MTQKKSYLKIFIVCILALSLLLPFGLSIGSAFANTKLTVNGLIGNYYQGSDKDQEITNELDFSTDNPADWTIPEYLDKPKYKIEDNKFKIGSITYTILEEKVVYGEIEYAIIDDSFTIGDLTYRIVDGYVTAGESVLKNDSFPYNSVNEDGDYNLVNIVDLSSDEEFIYNGTAIKYSSITNAGTGTNALMFLTSTSGVLGVESPSFKIPAHALYVLTFRVRVVNVNNSKGLNAKIISSQTGEEVVNSMTSRTTTTSTTYAFLIRGNEFSEQEVKLQLLWGNVTEKTENGEKYYEASGEKGYVIVNDLQMFSVTTTQYEELATETTRVKTVNLSTSSSPFITNGGFSLSNNRVWNLSESNRLNDITPSGWTQTTEETTEEHRLAHYGIINVNPSVFDQRIAALGLPLINPGLPNPHATNQNVLVLYNGQSNGVFENINTYQTITSGDITLRKDKYYEISFRFNTPALTNNSEDENNSLNFYIMDSNGNALYSREDIYSYTEWTDDANEWTTFRCFIKTPSDDKKVKFLISFGTEDNTKSGYAYVDNVRVSEKLSANVVFNNTLEDTFVLTTEEEEETSYLATGMLSFEDLKALDLSNDFITNDGVNRSFGTYDFTTAVVAPGDDEDDDDDDDDDDEQAITTPGANIEYLWYVIPSVLLGVSTIMGLIIFYAQRIKSKIKRPKKYNKGAYDRKKTLEKQISEREKEALKSQAVIQKDLDNVRAKITKLESNYQKSKSNPLALKDYIRKREKLQNEEIRLQDKLNKK